MSDFAPATIRRSVVELLQGEIGNHRELLQGIFKYGTFVGQPLQAEQAHSLMADFGRNWFGVRLGRPRPSPASPSSAMGSFRRSEYPLTIDVLTHLQSTVEEEERDDVESQVQQDLELAVQAIGYPSNLDADSEGNATGIVDGCSLREPEYVAESDWNSQLVRSRIEATLLIEIVQEV